METLYIKHIIKSVQIHFDTNTIAYSRTLEEEVINLDFGFSSFAYLYNEKVLISGYNNKKTKKIKGGRRKYSYHRG